MRRLALLACIVGLLSACENGTPSSLPAAPSPAPAAPVVTYTLSGVVFETTHTGRVPIADVSAYCDACGDPLGHTFATTDGDGFYSFDWTSNGPTGLIVRRAGYAVAGDPPDGPLAGWIVANVNGNTRFDIELVRH